MRRKDGTGRDPRFLGFTLLVLWLAAPLAAASQPLQALQQRLQSADVVRGVFEQEKQLAGFRNPLRSRGHFLLAREHGVIWDTEQPFPSALVIGPNGLRLDGDSQAAPAQALARVNQLLIALIGGDLQVLNAEFELEVDAAATPWTLRLRARDPQLAQRLQDLVLRGDAWVEHVEFRDEHGNSTRIEFSQQSAVPPQLSADEAARFD